MDNFGIKDSTRMENVMERSCIMKTTENFSVKVLQGWGKGWRV